MNAKAIDEMMALIKDAPPDPLHGARVMLCPPWRIAEIREKLGTAAESPHITT